MSQQILIVEDETRLAQVLGQYLKQAGYQYHHLENGLEVIPRAQMHPPDLILLDLMLPGKDGIEICRELRTFSEIPIIMITARVAEIDRLIGLEIGADDYICKPFSNREVVARVKTIFRRMQMINNHPSNQLSSMGIQLNESTHHLAYQKKSVLLTAIEFQLFKHMFSQPGRIFSRNQLMTHIYPDQRIVNDRTIDSHIRKLRKKCAQLLSNQEMIHSVYSLGYKFEWVDVHNPLNENHI